MPAHEQSAEPSPFALVRDDLHELLTVPVQRWTTAGNARRTAAEYQHLLTIPLDLAACGFTVTITQTKAGWEIGLTRKLTEEATLQVHAVARSYVAALFQVADRATRAVGDMERNVLDLALIDAT